MSGQLIFGTFHFVRGEKRRSFSPACTESNFLHLVKAFDSAGLLATSADFDKLHEGAVSNASVQSKKVFFTFDDGYIEHYDFCADVLEEFDSRGFFFPVVSSLQNRDILDVNIIQLICAIDTYANIAQQWLSKQEEFGNPLVRSDGFSPAIFDSANTQYIKRNLQSSSSLMSTLEGDTGLVSLVKSEHSDYFDNLYFNYSQAQDLYNRGHIIGGHGNTHCWLTEAPTNSLSTEISESYRLVSSLSNDKENRPSYFCYPYGLTSHRVSLKTMEFFDYCFTTEFGVLTSYLNKEIPRVDVNMLDQFL